jgi:hypothetical protein
MSTECKKKYRECVPFRPRRGRAACDPCDPQRRARGGADAAACVIAPRRSRRPPPTCSPGGIRGVREPQSITKRIQNQFRPPGIHRWDQTSKSAHVLDHIPGVSRALAPQSHRRARNPAANPSPPPRQVRRPRWHAHQNRVPPQSRLKVGCTRALKTGAENRIFRKSGEIRKTIADTSLD